MFFLMIELKIENLLQVCGESGTSLSTNFSLNHELSEFVDDLCLGKNNNQNY